MTLEILAFCCCLFLRSTNRKKDGQEHRYFSVVENQRVAADKTVPRTVIVETEHHHIVFGDQLLFGEVDRVLVEVLRLILVIVEGRLVRDDEIPAARGGPLQHVQRGHHGSGDAFRGRVRVSGFDSVDRGLALLHSEVLADLLEYLLSGERGWAVLGGGNDGGGGGDSCESAASHARVYRTSDKV